VDGKREMERRQDGVGSAHNGQDPLVKREENEVWRASVDTTQLVGQRFSRRCGEVR
jgi:hypothetical protein